MRVRFRAHRPRTEEEDMDCDADARVDLWQCLVCKNDDDIPTMNRSPAAAPCSQAGGSMSIYDFCCKCRAYRYDRNKWLCHGKLMSWRRCNHVIEMSSVPLGVPRCPICKTVRKNSHEDDVFRRFSNIEDEKMPTTLLSPSPTIGSTPQAVQAVGEFQEMLLRTCCFVGIARLSKVGAAGGNLGGLESSAIVGA